MDSGHIGKLVYLMLPVILAGIFNMVLVKLPVLENFKTPMDRGKVLPDGKRLFGDHKTWKGFWGMVVLTSLFMGLFGIIYDHFIWAKNVSLVPYDEFSFPFNAWFYGAVWGFGYVLFELPNSYIKRRIDIQPGKQGSGAIGKMFTVVDQADSVFGCLIFMLPFYVPSLRDAILMLVMATVFHYILNILLYLVGLKKQAG